MAGVPGDGLVGILGASRFVVRKRIAKAGLRGDSAVALSCFESFLAGSEIVEPSPDEQAIATRLEAAAQKMALNLDAGESQLVALVVTRVLPWLLTGDKRAITSLEMLLPAETCLSAVGGKIRCLEQLVMDALLMGDANKVRRAICAEPSVDKALSICFSCTSAGADPATAQEGLASYIADLRSRAVHVLAT